MNPPAVIRMPLSTMENMVAELSWMFLDLFEQIDEIYEELEDIKDWLKYGDSPKPPPPFDPLKTIGKHR